MPWKSNMGLWFTGTAIIITVFVSVFGWWLHVETRQFDQIRDNQSNMIKHNARMRVLESKMDTLEEKLEFYLEQIKNADKEE